MFKTLSAAFVAASVLLAPMASVTASAAQPATKTIIVTTKTVKMVKAHKRHFVRHHDRRKHVRHGRTFNKHGLHLRHGKFFKSHKRALISTKVRARTY